MSTISIEEPGRDKVTGLAPFALGFRPFFWLAGVGAVLLMALWLAVYGGLINPPQYYGPALWHGHEMIFGFAAAVVAGFLLTAVGNWTGQKMPHGIVLAGLALVWLAGRVMPFVPGAPAKLIAAVDLAFAPLVAIAIMIPIVRAKNYRNLIFIAILLALALANAVVHKAMLLSPWFKYIDAAMGNALGLLMLVLTITIMGGRVIPFFIERGAGVMTKKWKAIEWLAPLSMIALWPLALIELNIIIASAFMLFVAAVHGMRLAGWWGPAVFRVPLCWVLLVAYGWIVVGLLIAGLGGVLNSMFPIQWDPYILALHAIAAGGIGGMTLGMMARVSLGHTSRPLAVSPLITTAFILINVAVFVRVIMPMVLPMYYKYLIYISGGLWIAAFALFVFVYTPILMRPRIDGRPG